MILLKLKTFIHFIIFLITRFKFLLNMKFNFFSLKVILCLIMHQKPSKNIVKNFNDLGNCEKESDEKSKLKLFDKFLYDYPVSLKDFELCDFLSFKKKPFRNKFSIKL